MKRRRYPWHVLLVLAALGSGCAARPEVRRAESAEKAGDACEATQHYLAAVDVYERTTGFVRWWNRRLGRRLGERRDQAARQCAIETRRRVLETVSPDGERELKLYDRFYALTRGATGVEPTLRDALAVETRLAAERYRREALGERDGLRNYAAREKARASGRFVSQEVLALLAASESAAEWHLGLARAEEASRPARAYFHHRMAERQGAAQSGRTEALLAEVSRKLEPHLAWRFAGSCQREERELEGLVRQGSGEVIEVALDLRVCEAMDERWSERVPVGRPGTRVVNEVKTVEKETRLVLGEGGYVESDRRILVCDWRPRGTTKQTLCRLQPNFYARHRNEFPEVLEWKGEGPFVFHWKEEELVQVAYDVSERELKTVRRWRVGFKLDGTAKLAWGSEKKDVAVRVERAETEANTQYAADYTPEVALVRRKAMGEAALGLRSELGRLVVERHLARAQAAAEAGRTAEAEEEYLLAALAEPTARALRPEAANWLHAHYGLEGEAARALLLE